MLNDEAGGVLSGMPLLCFRHGPFYRLLLVTVELKMHQKLMDGLYMATVGGRECACVSVSV